MKKYFLYELKKHLWTLVILTAVCTLPYIVHMATTMMFYEHSSPVEYGGEITRYIYGPGIANVFSGMLILLFVVPIIMYSFKMSKRGVDGYYSLPLKKEKMYFALTLVGLILVIVPYTVAFWSGFFTLLFRAENPYNMWYFFPIYFGGVVFAVFLYGINAFVFTRANRISDGVVLMVAYAFVFYLLVNVIDYEVFHISTRIGINFLFSGGMFEFVSLMEAFVTRATQVYLQYIGWYFGVAVLSGSLCYGLLFGLLRCEKGENAEQNCESWFGYKTLIPAYVFLCAWLGAFEEATGLIFVLVAAVIATIVYKRTFRLKWMDFLPLAVGLVLGVVWLV